MRFVDSEVLTLDGKTFGFVGGGLPKSGIPGEVALDVYQEKVSKKARIVDRDEEGRASKVEFHVAPGLLPEMRYVLHYSYSDDGITWDYVEDEPLKDISGSYRVEGNGGTTHVTYNLAIEPGIPLPGFVKARAAREISRIALKELKRRVEEA